MKSLQPLSIQTTSKHTELSMQEEKLKVEEVEEEGQEIELVEEGASEETPVVETKQEEKAEEPAKEEGDELENYSDSVKKKNI